MSTWRRPIDLPPTIRSTQLGPGPSGGVDLVTDLGVLLVTDTGSDLITRGV